MKRNPVRVRELSAWGFDDYACRPSAISESSSLAAVRVPYSQQSAVVHHPQQTLLQAHAQRADLLLEMHSLDWSLGFVDLRCLLAFQRRLSFDPDIPQPAVPNTNDITALVDFSFGPAKPIFCSTYEESPTSLLLQSADPNLQARFTSDLTQLVIPSNGSPFFEVAEYRDRWFLRDGYHRAYCLLRSGINVAPAVVVKARTLAELGATKPHFFPENTLFSDHPPRLTDFLDDDMNVEYTRPRLIKTLRVTVEQSFIPETNQGDDQ
jgi:hypothetical protein